MAVGATLVLHFSCDKLELSSNIDDQDCVHKLDEPLQEDMGTIRAILPPPKRADVPGSWHNVSFGCKEHDEKLSHVDQKNNQEGCEAFCFAGAIILLQEATLPAKGGP